MAMLWSLNFPQSLGTQGSFGATGKAAFVPAEETLRQNQRLQEDLLVMRYLRRRATHE